MLVRKAERIKQQRSGFVDKKYLIGGANIVLMEGKYWVATSISLEGLKRKLMQGSSSHIYYEGNINQNMVPENRYSELQGNIIVARK